MRRLRDLQAPAYSPEIPVWISWNDGRAAVWLIFPRRSLLPMCRAAWRAQPPHLRQLAWRATAGAAFGAGPTIPGTGGSGPIPRRVRFVGFQVFFCLLQLRLNLFGFLGKGGRMFLDVMQRLSERQIYFIIGNAQGILR